MSGGGPAWADVATAGEWQSWPGLPGGLGEPEVTRALGIDAGSADRRQTRLGSRTAELAVAGPARWWTVEGEVVLVQLEDPRCSPPPAELLARLGTADRTGDGRWLRFGATTIEHVYAARGMSLTVAESYLEPPAFEPYVAAILLFRPTDLVRFVLDLGGNDRPGPRS
jgi:hypothetical protein